MRLLSPAVFLLPLFLAAPFAAPAQGTRQWTTTRFEEFERGTPHNIAIRNDGRIEPAPELSLLSATSETYLWSVLAMQDGSILAGTGAASGGSKLLRLAPSAKTLPEPSSTGAPTTGTGNSDIRTTVLAGFKELNVQALAALPDGSLLAATSPDGKLYRISPGGEPQVVFDPSATAEKPKYLWSIAVEPGGTVLLAAGAPAVLYRISLKPGAAAPQVLFHSGDQHIRTLLLAPDGTIFAGSDGAGILYRISPGGKPFALFTAPKHEITALALDPEGNLYAAAAGDRRPPSLPPLPAQGEPRISITFQQPASSAPASTNALVPNGSEVYRIAKDGTPLRLMALPDEIVYGLSFRHGNLFVATGNRGHIYRADPERSNIFTDVAHVEAGQAVALSPRTGGLVVATANSGKLLLLNDDPAADSTYVSDVFDGETATLWGRAELTGSASGIDLFARSGNVENARSGLGDLWSAWKPVAPGQTPLPVPVARYLQWKAVLHPGAQISSLAVNYLPRNLPPLVEDVIVQTGARLPAAPPTPPPATVPVAFRPAPAPPAAASAAAPPPINAQKDPHSVTARWIAHDPNGDNLTFSLYVRDVRETNWHLLKKEVTDQAVSVDTALLPDGQYEMRILASDAPSHNASDALDAERISAPFLVDTTPPVPGPLNASVRGGRLEATFQATDATSPIAHAEFSLDAGPWQYLDPVGKLSDSLSESYRLSLPVPAGEHTIAIRVFDRAENSSSAKSIVR